MKAGRKYLTQELNSFLQRAVMGEEERDLHAMVWQHTESSLYPDQKHRSHMGEKAAQV